MNRNIKYKQVCRIGLFGDDDINTSSNVQNSVGGSITNSKRIRFALNNSLNDVKLSQNARCVVETCNVPSFANLAGKYILLRLVVSSQDKTCDTKKFLNGNPILLSMATNTLLGSTHVLYNASEFFHNLNVPTNILSQGYIDMELEVPAATANIDFITGKPLNTFFINLIIVDEDMSAPREEQQGLTHLDEQRQQRHLALGPAR